MVFTLIQHTKVMLKKIYCNKLKINGKHVLPVGECAWLSHAIELYNNWQSNYIYFFKISLKCLQLKMHLQVTIYITQLQE